MNKDAAVVVQRACLRPHDAYDAATNRENASEVGATLLQILAHYCSTVWPQVSAVTHGAATRSDGHTLRLAAAR